MLVFKLGAGLLASVLAVGAVAAGTSVDDGPAFTPGEFRNTALGKLISGNIGRAMVLRSELDVTDEQRAKVREVLKSHKDEIGGLLTKGIEQRRALRDATSTDDPDEEAIRAAADQLGKTIGEAAVLKAKIRSELRPHFTDEQVKRVEEFMNERDASIDKFLQKKFGT